MCLLLYYGGYIMTKHLNYEFLYNGVVSVTLLDEMYLN